MTRDELVAIGIAPDDDGLQHAAGERFTIVHAGAFFGQRTPRPFLQALAAVLTRRPDLDGRVLARFVGELRGDDRSFAQGLGIDGGDAVYLDVTHIPARVLDAKIKGGRALETKISDLTSGQSGFMIASGANGFMHTNPFDCTGTKFL